MSKRYYVQRQHIIASLDLLLYQLHAVSFFLSPSLFLSFCRLVAQFICLKPRELGPGRALRFFYLLFMLLNLPSICTHLFRGGVDGRAIILDFIGNSHNPSSSRFHLCCLDLFIIFFQLLLVTISYETSIYHTTEDADSIDILLPHSLEPVPKPLLLAKDSSIFSSSQLALPNTMPTVIDFRIQSIAAHFYHAPPSRRARYGLLPLPNTSPLEFSGMRTLLGHGRSMRRPTGGAAGGRETRMPGAIDITHHR